ncbi:MAG TPA: ABC transporter substrate-binding protein [Candidatus Acidoferrales bacterium]|nr:ABC transporter substrate-binding protein [Candidatus Acidoferrales bacterium]
MTGVPKSLEQFRRRLAAACGVAALACCSGARTNAGVCSTMLQAAVSEQTSAPVAVPAKKMTREVVDEVGRHVIIPNDVRRIVSLAPNLTEIVYALGAQDRLAGVSAFTDYPPDAKTKPSVGMPVNPSLEAIAGAQPDVVLVTSAINRLETVNALEQAGIAVYATDPHTVEGTLDSIRHIGGVIGAQTQAETLVAKLQQQLDALKAKLAGVAPTRVLFVVWDQPLQSIGENTFIADALRWAGAESVIHTKQNWPLVGMEEIVKLNPGYIIYAENQMGEDAGNDSPASLDISAAIARHLTELRGEPGWRDLPAVRDGHVAVISDEVNLPAPGLVGAIEQLAQELHPEAFTPKQPAEPNASEEHSASRLWVSLRQQPGSEERSCAR